MSTPVCYFLELHILFLNYHLDQQTILKFIYIFNLRISGKIARRIYTRNRTFPSLFIKQLWKSTPFIVSKDKTIFYDSLLSLVGELSSDVRALDFPNEEVPNFVPSVKKSFAARGRSGMSKNASEFPALDIFVLHVIATDHGVGASINSVEI